MQVLFIHKFKSISFYVANILSFTIILDLFFIITIEVGGLRNEYCSLRAISLFNLLLK